MKLSKSQIANILYGFLFILLILPLYMDYRIRNEEMSRKSTYVKTHDCKVAQTNGKRTYYDWQSNTVKVTDESTKYTCTGLDTAILLRPQ